MGFREKLRINNPTPSKQYLATVSGKDFGFTPRGLPESKMPGQRQAFRGDGIELDVGALTRQTT